MVMHYPHRILAGISITLMGGVFLIGAIVQRAEPAPVQATQQQDILRFSTYLGGSDTDTGSALAMDAAGYIYIAGQTASRDFPTRNAIMGYQGGRLTDTDVFIAKLSPAGDSLIYATYLGGSGDELLTALVLDAAGRVLLAGSTTSDDFPTHQPLQPYRGGAVLQSDAFLARLSADGTRLDFATYLGGTGEELITALALGPAGELYITGTTQSPDFPTTPGTFQETYAGGGMLRADGFVAKLIPDGAAFLVDYATYLGGRMDEVPAGIAADPQGRAYVTGFTNSPDFPTRRALQPDYAGPMRDGEGDVFVTQISPDGARLDFSTYLGSTEDDQGTGLVWQPDGSLYLTGWTRSGDFPATPNALQPALRGTSDAFLVRLMPSGTSMALDYATFLGGNGEDAAYGLAVSPDASVWISGATDGVAFPQATPFQPVPGGGPTDAFVAHLVAGEDTLRMATYLGGSDNEAVPRAAMGTDGTVCVTGSTRSPNFPTWQAWQATPGGTAFSAFASCFGDAPAPVSTEDISDVPVAFALHANYPNPFNPATIIPFSVARPSRVVLEIFDVTGRRMTTLLDRDHGPGTYEIRFDARGLASGLYLYRIRMGDFQATRAFVLVR